MEFIDFVLEPKFYLPFVYVAVGYFSYIIIKKIIKSIFNKRKGGSLKNKKRYNTLVQVTVDCIKIVIIFLVILSVLSVYGVDVTSALAGIGIVSAIIGLAFQDLFKDLIAGFSIIIEDYYSVGDTIEVNGFKGEVLHIGIKSTKIKKFDGPVLIISNRNIDKVINYSNTHSLAIVEVSVSYETDINKVEKVLKELFARITPDIPEIVGDIDIWGVDNLEASGVIIKVAAKTETLKHFAVERRLRKEIKLEFDKKGIKIPYTQVEVHHG